MIGALWILLATVVAGLAIYVHYRLTYNPEEEAKQEAEAADDDRPEGCCGQHLVCEKESLLLAGEKIEYYDDEELDQFKDRDENDFTEEELEQFRDVLYTLRSEDRAGWSRSIQLRGVTLPAAIREELVMLLGESRVEQAQRVINQLDKSKE